MSSQDDSHLFSLGDDPQNVTRNIWHFIDQDLFAVFNLKSLPEEAVTGNEALEGRSISGDFYSHECS